MATHLLVDGYNLVGSAGMAPPAGSGRLEAAREAAPAPMPDYVFPWVGHEGLATAAAGVVGAIVVFALAGVLGRVVVRSPERE